MPFLSQSAVERFEVCPRCLMPNPHGPTTELLAWAKRCGEQEVMQAVERVDPRMVGRVHIALIKSRAAR